MVSTEYERFILQRNQYDAQVCLAPYCTDLLQASVRRHVCVVGATKTAAELYRLADIISVKGIDDSDIVKPTAPAAEKKSEIAPKRSATVARIALRIALAIAIALVGASGAYLVLTAIMNP